MWPSLVVVPDPISDALPGFAARLKGVQVDALILEGPPEALDHDVVRPAPLAVHGNLDTGILELLDEIQARELADLAQKQRTRY